MSKFQEIINSDQPTLVDFYADWCGPCKSMAPVLDELGKEVQGQARILKVNVDKAQAASAKFGIRGVPTFILFKNGEVKWRGSGAMPKSALKEQIDYYSA